MWGLTPWQVDSCLSLLNYTTEQYEREQKVRVSSHLTGKPLKPLRVAKPIACERKPAQQPQRDEPMKFIRGRGIGREDEWRWEVREHTETLQLCRQGGRARAFRPC